MMATEDGQGEKMIQAFDAGGLFLTAPASEPHGMGGTVGRHVIHVCCSLCQHGLMVDWRGDLAALQASLSDKRRIAKMFARA
jgi:hypothetical protein